MFFLDPEKLQSFRENIAEGFNKNSLEIVFSILFILFIFTFFILLFRHFIKKARDGRLKKALRFFDGVIEKKLQNEKDRIILAAIRRVCKGREDLLPKIVTDLHFFNKYAGEAMKEEIFSYRDMILTRNHLGLFPVNFSGKLKTTAELPAGVTFLLSGRRGEKVEAAIAAITDRGVSILCKEFAALRGDIVMIFENRAGFYRIKSRVLSRSGKMILAAHSEVVSRVQRRKFFRKKITLPVAFRTASDERFVKTRLLDLSGGGALIRNPGLQVRTNQQLFLVFLRGKQDTFAVPAKVVRAGEASGLFSVAFHSLKEPLRDKIIKMIL